MTYTEHLQHTEALRNTMYLRSKGKGYRVIDGKLIPEAEFQAMHKLPVRCYIAKENPCNKHKFLG